MSSNTEITRLKILDAAWKMLESGPPQAVRMADIAKRAGVSRQAVYLHFDNRNNLIQETRNHIDEQFGFAGYLEGVMANKTGQETLHAYVDLWADYLPRIRGVASALLAAKADDEAAGTAWDDCMMAHRAACSQIVDRLTDDGVLSAEWDKPGAVDMIWALLSFETWQLLVMESNWSSDLYRKKMKRALSAILEKQP